MADVTFYCMNCKRPIGRLEKPKMWKNYAVCTECYERLKKQYPGITVSRVLRYIILLLLLADSALLLVVPEHVRVHGIIVGFFLFVMLLLTFVTRVA